MEARFSAPVETGPGAHPASCAMGTGSFPGVKSGLGVTLTPHSLLVPWSRKCRAIRLLLLWAVRLVQSLSACTRVYFILVFSVNRSRQKKILVPLDAEGTVTRFCETSELTQRHSVTPQIQSCDKIISCMMYLYRARSKITQFVNTNTCTTKFLLKKNPLKNSYMFRSTTIFRESIALARTHTLGCSTNINRYKQHDMLPHHRTWYTYNCV